MTGVRTVSSLELVPRFSSFIKSSMLVMIWLNITEITIYRYNSPVYQTSLKTYVQYVRQDELL